VTLNKTYNYTTMALSKENVQKGWRILNEVNPMANNSFISEFDPEDPFRENLIIGEDKKSDGGWECIFLNIINITPDQISIFERRKNEVHNSSFFNYKGNGITRIGWF